MNHILFINSTWPIFLYEKYGITSISTFRNLSPVEKYRKAMQSSLGLSKKKYFYQNDWWKICNGFDIIILFDSSQDIIKQAQRIESTASPDARLILYMLNPISYSRDYDKLSKRWEVWSFSKKESQENGFSYGETFYFKELTDLNPLPDILYDSFFVGLNKGRMKYLKDLKRLYINKNISPLFYIVDNKKALYDPRYKRRLPYSEVIKYITSSKSITDVVQENQEGLTLRVLESIFFKRKLITNNLHIRKRSLYNSENIFILGYDNNKDLYQFINSPYRAIDNKEVKKYEFSSWLNRIIKRESFE